MEQFTSAEGFEANNQRENISQSSISKHLAELGEYKVPLSVPILSTKNKEKRLEYALSYNSKFPP